MVVVVVSSLSCVRFLSAHQAPLSTGFFRQEYWSGLPFPSPGDLPDPGIEPGSPALQADSLLTELREAHYFAHRNYNRFYPQFRNLPLPGR